VTSSFIKALISAAVASTAAVVAFACSSSSSPPPAGQSSDDAAVADTGATQDGTTGDGEGAPDDAAVTMSTPCDAGASLPGDGGTGYACGACLKANCAPQLTECQQSSCLCVASVECLVTHDNNYTLCTDTAMVAIFSDQGLIDAAACLTSKCLAICDGADH
jgi:hypothetical protein